MALWGNLDASNNAPASSAVAGYGGNTPQVTSNAEVYYANTKLGSFMTNAAIGVFAVDAVKQSATATSTTGGGHPQHAGWVIRKVGMGPVTEITANAGSICVNSFVTLTGGLGNSGSNGVTTISTANARVFVNTTGHIMNVTLQVAGFYANTPIIGATGNIYTGLTYFQNTAAISTSSYSNAVFSITMGGRANRVQTETIVAMGSIYGSANTVY